MINRKIKQRHLSLLSQIKQLQLQRIFRNTSSSLILLVLFFAISFVDCKNKHQKFSTKTIHKPNFIVIFTDDQGYGDLRCFGGNHVHTPAIDKMAEEGMKLTSFYVAAPVCTPSRAALMTGCYPKRIDMATGSTFPVLLAGDKKGLNPDEITIAEVLKNAGYATGIFGKWHLGDQPEFLPTKQGFDEYYGIPYSHDIHSFHPDQDYFNFPSLPLLEGEKVIEMNPDANYFTRRITERAIQFIEKKKEQPFFLYIPHPIPHEPLHVSPPFMEEVDEQIKVLLDKENNYIDYSTRKSLYKQAISEIDWSVGQILSTLNRLNLSKNTFVIFTSDNGPSVGSSGPLKGKKGTTHEGGMRVPTVVYWPGKIPAGHTNDELMTAMDLLPTFAKLSGAEIPNNRVIDGKDIMPTILGKEKSPHEAFFYYKENELQAIRSEKWKLRVKGDTAVALFDLTNDISESKNVINMNEEIVNQLLDQLIQFKTKLADNKRPAAFVDNPVPLMIK